MKKKLPALVLAVVFLLGASVFLYPTLSDWLARHNATQLLESYNTIVEDMHDDERDAEWQRAENYNQSVAHGNVHDPFSNDASPTDEYLSILNIQNGIMGRIEIPEIDVSLPIYHTTGEDVLQRGAGHIEGTSFPIGGEGTHAVITGHSGLSTAKLFTDLELLTLGDIFTVTVLGETIAYEIDQILVVEPTDADALQLVPGMDYVTLVTCTPYAINSHRLLVRGIRTELPPEEATEAPQAKTSLDIRILVLAAFLLLWLVLLIVFLVKRKKPK